VWILNTNAPLPKEGEGSSGAHSPSPTPEEGRIFVVWAPFPPAPEDEGEAGSAPSLPNKKEAWFEVDPELQAAMRDPNDPEDALGQLPTNMFVQWWSTEDIGAIINLTRPEALENPRLHRLLLL
jgi:hypothetical protein